MLRECSSLLCLDQYSIFSKCAESMVYRVHRLGNYYNYSIYNESIRILLPNWIFHMKRQHMTSRCPINGIVTMQSSKRFKNMNVKNKFVKIRWKWFNFNKYKCFKQFQYDIKTNKCTLCRWQQQKLFYQKSFWVSWNGLYFSENRLSKMCRVSSEFKSSSSAANHPT